MNFENLLDVDKMFDSIEYNSIGIVGGALRPIPVTLFENATSTMVYKDAPQYCVFEGYGDSLSEIWM